MLERPNKRDAQRILVAYASRRGAAQKLALYLGEMLGETGLGAEVLAADEVVRVSPYDAVVLGSSVYGAHWLPEAVEFFESFQEELAAKPLWLFSTVRVELEGVQAQAVSRYVPASLAVLAAATKPEDSVLFGNTLDALDLTSQADPHDQEAVRGWTTTIIVRLHQQLTARPCHDDDRPPERDQGA